MSNARSEYTKALREFEDLRQRISDLRKQLPAESIEDFTLTSAEGSPVQLSELFGDKDDLIVVHNMGKGCPYCTLWADGFNGVRHHLEDRAAFVVVSPDAPEVMSKFALDRGWHFRMLSNKGSGFTKSMGYEGDKGEPFPGVSAFHREPDGSIVRTNHAPFGPGDDFCSTWHLFDLLKDGANGWGPKFDY